MLKAKEIMDNKELTMLYSFFELPSIVSNLLEKNKELSAEEEYNMHEILCEMQPDSVLIAMALCARNIATHINNERSNKLLSHAAYITNEYASEWLANANEESSSDIEDLQSLLAEAPEDLSIMSCLLTSCAASIKDKKSPLAKICNIMAIQSASQSDIAIAYLDAIEKSLEIRESTEIKIKFTERNGYNSNNVVPFSLV